MKKIKTILLVFLVINISLFALQDKNTTKQNIHNIPDEIKMNFAKEYIINGHGKYDSNISDVVKNDENFKLANQYLNDETKFYQPQFPKGMTAETIGIDSKKLSAVKIPNYKMALEYLAKSIREYSNPVSAYEFRYIVKTFYGERAKQEYKELLPVATRILYQNDVCEAIIDYGMFLEASGKDQEAVIVYMDGMNKCKQSNWVANVLAGRVAYIEKIKNKNKAREK